MEFFGGGSHGLLYWGGPWDLVRKAIKTSVGAGSLF